MINQQILQNLSDLETTRNSCHIFVKCRRRQLLCHFMVAATRKWLRPFAALLPQLPLPFVYIPFRFSPEMSSK